MVLAAGAARRFGGAKMLADFRGRPLIAWAVQSALDTLARRVVVVIAAGDAALEGALASMFPAALAAGRLVVTPCPDAGEGLGASLRHGAGQCDAAADGVFIFLGDMPLIPPAVGPELVRALRAGAAAAVPAWQGRRGHPVLVGPSLRPALLDAQGDVGLSSRLDALGPRLTLVEGPGAGVLFDVDTPEQLAWP